MIYVGIDYSISSPGMTIYDERKGPISPLNCKHYAFTDFPHKFSPPNNITLLEYPKEYRNNTERYSILANTFNDIIDETTKFLSSVTYIGIEGYSMGSVGKVFNLAENCGILKYVLSKTRSYAVKDDITPSTWKKLLIGHGHAKKHEIYRHYLDEGGIDIHNLLTPNKKLESSFVMDIVDSYYICKYLLTEN